MSTLPTEFATKKMSRGEVRRNRESGGGQRKAAVQKRSGELEPGEKHLLLLVRVEVEGAGWRQRRCGVGISERRAGSTAPAGKPALFADMRDNVVQLLAALRTMV